jgi:rhomboid protease GluP
LVILNVVLALAAGGALAWEAHLGGFVAGWAMGMRLAR